MRKLFAFCLISLIIPAFFISACAVKPKSSKPTITIWHWMTDRQPAFEALAKKYEEQTGIKVNFELYAPSDAYSQKVRAAAQGKTLPDIYGLLGEKRDFASFIKSDHVADLTPFLEENNGKWRKEFFAKALAVNEFKEDNTYGVKAGFYGVPIDVMTIEMLYNKKLFKKAGLDPNNPPATWGEFLHAIQRLREVGIQGLVSGWGEIWMIDCLASNYAFNIMGEKKVLATIKGEVPYTDPDWIKVFDLFLQMRDKKVLVTGVITMVNKTAEQLFSNEKCAFAFNGSWCVNVYKGMNPVLDYGAMLPPQVSDKNPMMVWGGAASSFLVNNRSASKEQAVAFLKWLTSPEQQIYLAEATNNLPANQNALKGIPVVLAQFAEAMEYTTHPNIWGVSEFPAVIEKLDKGLQAIIIGENTPEQLAQDVQKIKAREMAKAKK